MGHICVITIQIEQYRSVFYRERNENTKKDVENAYYYYRMLYDHMSQTTNGTVARANACKHDAVYFDQIS